MLADCCLLFVAVHPSPFAPGCPSSAATSSTARCLISPSLNICSCQQSSCIPHFGARYKVFSCSVPVTWERETPPIFDDVVRLPRRRQDAKCSLCVGLISLAVVAALVLERLVSSMHPLIRLCCAGGCRTFPDVHSCQTFVPLRCVAPCCRE